MCTHHERGCQFNCAWTGRITLVISSTCVHTPFHRMEAAAEILRRMPPRVYHHDFDDNGILNYVATNGGTTAYVNPHTSGKVVVTPSSMSPNYCTVEGFIGRSPPTTGGGFNFTNNVAGSSVAIQLPLAVSVTRYTVRHGRVDQQHHVLRNWNFEGSNDGVEWVVLRQHANDQSLAARAHSTASWDVDNGDRAFSRFRILATGPGSSGNNYLAVGGLELYGQVGFAPGQVSHPPCFFFEQLVVSARAAAVCTHVSDTRTLASASVVPALSFFHDTPLSHQRPAFCTLPNAPTNTRKRASPPTTTRTDSDRGHPPRDCRRTQPEGGHGPAGA
jgi:hypothetical protein